MANRYSLVFFKKNGDKAIIKFSSNEGKIRESFSLTELDFMTTLFPNADMFSKYIGISDEDYKGGHFAIEYKSNKTLKHLELAFSDMTFIKDLAEKNFGNTKLSKESITSYMRWFLNKIDKEPEFLKFISTSRYTNICFKNALSQYLMLKRSDEKEAQSVLWQAEVRLKKEFMRYKTVRGLEIGRRNYELEKEHKMVPKDPEEISFVERAKREYELNHPKKIKRKKLKKSDPIEGQLPLFDTSAYTDTSIYEQKRTRR